ncbi:Enoyl-CoA hydratase [Candidatus Nitrosotalea sp. TS]|nr:Enoyl-CoA hydratase [Candidatus Nitrosotalea sp. TS]
MQYLKVEKENDIAQITIDRADKLNAMSLEVMNEFISDFRRIGERLIKSDHNYRSWTKSILCRCRH